MGNILLIVSSRKFFIVFERGLGLGGQGASTATGHEQNAATSCHSTATGVWTAVLLPTPIGALQNHLPRRQLRSG